ncbi:hypothetical protein CMV_006888 [Castanea mollissima]|uniref:Uncharacterized protein n=1 Tax=Castanea mollissima TaxID=60419 RepID=A0A8J4W394_9ROSI|nr:hypothetical protein CMV_006888 [Castanea mollissima]
MYNKYILDCKLYIWPFLISLTIIHMSFCSFLAYLLGKFFKVVELPSTMTRDLYLKSVVPIGALYSFSLWFSNSTYIYFFVSFIQMLKALRSFEYRFGISIWVSGISVFSSKSPPGCSHMVLKSINSTWHRFST